jgi:hypothetical protein
VTATAPSPDLTASEPKTVPVRPIPEALAVAWAGAWRPLRDMVGTLEARSDLGADAQALLADVGRELAILERTLWYAAAEWSDLLLQRAASAAVEWIDLASRRTPAPVLSRVAAVEAARLSAEVDGDD